VRLYATDGWVMANSHPASSSAAFGDAVGIIFQSRPRGGYSHSFNSDNSFQIHAYGQQINHGGGSTVNQDAYAYHTMSHNTLLIDGLGQAQPGSGEPLFPNYARVAAFARGADYIYFAGDATRAYPRAPGDFSRWGFPLGDVYQQRALGYLKRFVRHVLFLRNRYFVIFDDLETESANPATFTWLYHILPDQPFTFTPEDFTVQYSVSDVQVKVVHIAYPSDLALEDRQNDDEMVNPVTGEDYRQYKLDGPQPAHNLWISNSTPANQYHFLAVIFPYKDTHPEPVITRVDDRTVTVESEPGVVDTIHFGDGPSPQATLVVDYPDIASACCNQ
jgi:hypothetical protein